MRSGAPRILLVLAVTASACGPRPPVLGPIVDVNLEDAPPDQRRAAIIASAAARPGAERRRAPPSITERRVVAAAATAAAIAGWFFSTARSTTIGYGVELSGEEPSGARATHAAGEEPTGAHAAHAADEEAAAAAEVTVGPLVPWVKLSPPR